jgi:hypothetical protein
MPVPTAANNRKRAEGMGGVFKERNGLTSGLCVRPCLLLLDSQPAEEPHRSAA